MYEVKQSKQRKKMYDFVHEIIGRNLTKEEHNTFKGLIKDFFDSTDKFVAYKEALNAKPIEHVLTCGTCKKTVTAFGYDQHQKARRKFICP